MHICTSLLPGASLAVYCNLPSILFPLPHLCSLPTPPSRQPTSSLLLVRQRGIGLTAIPYSLRRYPFHLVPSIWHLRNPPAPAEALRRWIRLHLSLFLSAADGRESRLRGSPPAAPRPPFAALLCQSLLGSDVGGRVTSTGTAAILYIHTDSALWCGISLLFSSPSPCESRAVQCRLSKARTSDVHAPYSP
ncbi:hypothetical protein GGS23DRAFT_384514 [Durotheca rogersii]|uniref:uncharacterized protein n=1 Tax=Durotheca rogersii TaxID=419775 RepID=UPI00221FA7AA|nr:uncharacterized protein GGS23DRAFT_384514 [Durotheca rogersii]KAI5866374.1 hypothetical protein GGS23DRAFT_384514 [Durotheca rogersii]